MSRLINKEIQGLNHLESLKKDLFFNTSDFDLKEAFFKIDNRNSGFISFDNLEEFLENKGCYLSHEQIINLLKRLDRNDDGKVNFEELKFSLLPNDGAVPAKTSALMSVTRHYENDFYDIYEPKQQVYEDYLKNELARNSKKNEKSVGFLDRKENSQHEEKKCRKDDNNPKYCRKHARPKQDLTQMYFKEQGELARTLKQFILLDKELEVMKKDLCIREDFELLTTFQIMDVKGKTVLSAYELEQALKKLEIYPSKYELFLFVKRYDKDSDGKFSYSDYIESMVPVELRNIVQKRKPVQENFNFNDFSQVS